MSVPTPGAITKLACGPSVHACTDRQQRRQLDESIFTAQVGRIYIAATGTLSKYELLLLGLIAISLLLLYSPLPKLHPLLSILLLQLWYACLAPPAVAVLDLKLTTSCTERLYHQAG